ASNSSPPCVFNSAPLTTPIARRAGKDGTKRRHAALAKDSWRARRDFGSNSIATKRGAASHEAANADGRLAYLKPWVTACRLSYQESSSIGSLLPKVRPGRSTGAAQRTALPSTCRMVWL